jgi:transcriptional regulator with XRE-family HTH domain
VTHTQAYVAKRVNELRLERGWSQSRLASEVRQFGLTWSPAAVAQVENGSQRADRLIELYALCAAFAVSLEELIGDHRSVQAPNGQEIDLELIQAALRGDQPDRPLQVSDDPFVIGRIAKRYGLESDEFLRAFRATFKRQTFTGYRDDLVAWYMYLELNQQPGRISAVSWLDAAQQVASHSVDESPWISFRSTDPSTRARRGHATRWIAERILRYLDDGTTFVPLLPPEHDGVEHSIK